MKYLILCLFISTTAFAEMHYSIGLDVFQATQKGVQKSNGNALQKPFANITGISIGTLKQHKKFFYGVRTNSLAQFTIKNNVKMANGFEYQEASKIQSNSFFFGTNLQHFSPYVIVSRLDTKTQIKSIQGTSKVRTIEGFYGVGFGVPIFGNQSLTFTYFFLPTDHNLKRFFGVSYSFYLK